ncbi:hypothetical protein GMST_43860 [Geomonas silvestris]|uniref:Uncharacterized protein n=1 Tax=Geomonas silvestris TaxID=2740184 RepID=A0A6V8MPY9_9BACT|nr:chromosome partitioning protein [Geomonas silvestris]GFO62061.1 hypothetical protein GMST_43860 [Geomonas silvestris]
MSNIYEALEQACGKKIGSGVSPELSLQTEVIHGLSLKKEMTWLHHQVEAILSKSSKMIQFIGSRRGEGVSTIVREFAKIAVERHGKSVLILDSVCQEQTSGLNVSGQRDYGWLDLVEEGKLIEKSFFRVGETNLYFAPISVQSSFIAPVKDVTLKASILDQLKDRFDLILIDSSSDTSTADSASIAKMVDGVIMILEAGKTKKKSALKLKKRIISNGGVIIGAVFNKRKYYIPDCIYKKLFL